MVRRNAVIATAVAGLFALSAGHARAAEGEKSAEKVKCEGANSCKGHGSCKSAQNACAGKNGCAGKSFMMMTPDECKAAKAKMHKAPEK